MSKMTVRLLAKILITNPAGELLLLQRSANDRRRPLGWDLPGGNVESGEDPNLAVLRELSEEAGLECTDSQICSVAAQTEPEYIVTLIYRGTIDGLPVILSHEHQQFRWLPLANIASTDLPEKYQKAALQLR